MPTAYLQTYHDGDASSQK